VTSTFIAIDAAEETRVSLTDRSGTSMGREQTTGERSK